MKIRTLLSPLAGLLLLTIAACGGTVAAPSQAPSVPAGQSVAAA